jgi:hypothetical protein
VKGSSRRSPRTGGYCQARKRLELPLLRRLLAALSTRVFNAVVKRRKFLGFDVVVVDGTGCDAPDTPRNRKSFPPSGEKTAGTGFQQIRLAGAFDLLTGALLKFSYGDCHDGEQVLWKGVFNSLEWSGRLLLGDTYYCSYGNMAMTLRRGGQFVFPLRSRTDVKKLGGRCGDRDVELRKPASRAKSWTKAEWDSMPKKLKLRLIEAVVERRGFKARKLRLITSLTDREKYPAGEVVALQSRRWDVELDFRAIKTVMGMEHLSCKSPAMLEREMLMHMIAYNLIRATMLEAAQDSESEPVQASFATGMACAKSCLAALAAASGKRSVAKHLASFRREFLAGTLGPRRRGRAEPRVIKTPCKAFPKMNRARHDYPQHQRAA